VGFGWIAIAGISTPAAQTRSLQPLVVVRLDPGSAGADGSRAIDPGTYSAGAGPALGGQEQLTPLPVTRLDDPGRSATLDAVRPISLRISEPLPVRDVLMMLVRETGLSLVMEPGIDATFVGELKDVTLRQALALAVHPQGLDFAVEGTAIRVFHRRAETRFFDVNIALARRSGEGETRAASASPADGASGSRAAVRWKVEADPFDGLAAGIQSLLSTDGKFSIDRAAGIAQVSDYPERLARVATYIESAERRLNRQVDVQAQVVEVTLTDPNLAGVDWTAAIERARTPGAFGVPTLNFQTFVAALGEQGQVSVIAAPRLQVLHNEPALMRVGIEDVSFVRPADAAGDDDDPVVPAAFLDGFALALTAHITADGAVTMTVAPSVTQPTGETRTHQGQRAPVVAIDQWSTAVRLRDGETLVLPGLRRDRDRRVPVESTGLIGLFRREQTQRTRSELAVLLTPRIRS
jgi:MSHA biogenesis protein MshL